MWYICTYVLVCIYIYICQCVYIYIYVWNPNRPQESLGHRMANRQTKISFQISSTWLWHKNWWPQTKTLEYKTSPRMGSSITLLLNWEKYNNSTNPLGNPESKKKRYNQLLFLGGHLPVLRPSFFVPTWVARSGIDINSTKDLLVQRRWGVWAPKITGRYTPSKLNSNFALKIGLNYPKRKRLYSNHPFFSAMC